MITIFLVGMESYNLKSTLTSKVNSKPIIFQKFPPVSHWGFSSMTTTKLAAILQDVNLKFRIGKRAVHSDVQWEGSCHYIQATLQDFCNWLSGDENCDPFESFDRHDFWAYADYMYVRDVFQSVPNFSIVDNIDWSKLGFCHHEGLDMAIWIGSTGAHTVCHYDTYGYNLVFQVSGRKRWILFPAEDSPYMYPTRLPYEESTVFSKVNILNPDLDKHPRFALAHPHIVVLEPGDLLFVPTHWWHFVENLETSISVNAWFPSDSDAQQRVNEAITRLLVSSSVLYKESTSKDLSTAASSPWINPTDRLSSVEENVGLLRNAFLDIFHEVEINPRETSEKYISTTCDCQCDVKTAIKDIECSFIKQFCFEHASSIIENWKFCVQSKHIDESNGRPSKLPRYANSSSHTVKNSSDREPLTFRNVVDCLTRPSVVDCIKKELENDLTELYS